MKSNNTRTQGATGSPMQRCFARHISCSIACKSTVSGGPGAQGHNLQMLCHGAQMANIELVNKDVLSWDGP